MIFQEYTDYFKSIAYKSPEENTSPYDNSDYVQYTKLNWVRMNRWLTTGKLSEQFINVLKGIDTYQHWIVITEPWCGDASHIIPFIELASRENQKISVSYELRDSEPFNINKYLTDGGKSIPKLIIRNDIGDDLGIWGPRPVECQNVYASLIAENAPFERIKNELQKWYNDNRGVILQNELQLLLQSISK